MASKYPDNKCIYCFHYHNDGKSNILTVKCRKKEGVYEYPYYIEVNYNDKICSMFCHDNCNTIRGKIIQLRKIGKK